MRRFPGLSPKSYNKQDNHNLTKNSLRDTQHVREIGALGHLEVGVWE